MFKMTRRTQKLTSVTARKFEGGLNVVDSELNLSSKYAVVLDNMYRGLEGSIMVRQGCKQYCDLTSISDGYQINGKYFAARNITVNSVGQVFSIDGSGAATRIWDSTIAAALRPGLVTWGPTDFVAFEEFAGSLTIHNGIDKPLIVNESLLVDYLADPATGSNLNVPIGRIVCKFAKHLVIAIGSELHVSDEDTSGVFVGDSGATYAAIFDLKTSVVSGPTDIVGLSPFRDWLLVHFQECTIPVQFNKITTPSDALVLAPTSDNGGTFNSYGSVSSRTAQDLGDMTLACDIVGVTSIAPATFTSKLSPDRPSRLVDPLIQDALSGLNNTTLLNSVFSQYDRLSSMYMLFIPHAMRENQTETHGFGYRYISKLGIEAWNTFSKWNWAWSSRSSEGLVFFGRANDNVIFVKGDEKKLPLYADFIGDQETWSDGTVFLDGTGLSPVSDVDTSGVPIRFVWELPWSDLKKRSIQKTIRYLLLDAQGTSAFTVKMFIDNKYIDRSDAGETFADGTLFDDDLGFIRNLLDNAEVLTPALTMEMVASDYGGYGEEPYGDIYGGGRNTGFSRNILFPTKCNLFKLRFEGETMRPLKIVGITPVYIDGSIRRNSDV
jgi:hypothetical protein